MSDNGYFDSSSVKSWAMLGFGALALYSGYQAYKMSKKLEEKEEKRETSMQETLQTMLMMQMKQQFEEQNEIKQLRERSNSMRRHAGSFDEQDMNVAKSQSKQGGQHSMSKNLLSNLSSQAMAPSTRRNRMVSDSRVNITRILLTGGPCAGKTTALAAISQDLTQLGYKVLVVPEAATLIMKGGAMIVSSGFTEQQGLLFQKALMKLQISLEDSFVDIGQMVEGTPVVILIDRGLLDGSAYVSQNNWQALLDDLGCNTVMLRDNRYDAVVHLVTAADGAEKFYASLNNEARYESVEEAVNKDRRLREAYLGHQKWYIIDNSVDDFNQKINKAKERVQEALGHKVGQSFYKKFLLKKNVGGQGVRTSVPVDFAKGQSFEESLCYETFIGCTTSEGKVLESSVEKKGNNRAFTYTHKILIERKGEKMQKKRSISASEYVELEQSKVKSLRQVMSQRICTIDEGIYMIIDYYPEIDGQPLICIIQVNEEEHKKEGGARIKLPSYLQIEHDITDLSEFQPKSLAQPTFKASEAIEAAKSSRGVKN